MTYTGFLSEHEIFAIFMMMIDEDNGGIRVEDGAYSRQMINWVN